ncbi:CDP-diacylglycerol---serine O-phosphatidyltransferase [Evansella caseinilytica]|uniref:CDP-diacylglycerol--serine O-phosphatidyltransferase n=1 Tax=Evansella caseinilytica TaxID=1503961 RepID=A0A1H3KEG2_9BACI|nr:CDP-diacylglycerol--serine O-phosphatidyltransferase [Evansella caseinilytica]SDY49954.1 CDP-diacylglycerol---serine O-phosphatidyltransferase [Evansella caseinilytica]
MLLLQNFVDNTVRKLRNQAANLLTIINLSSGAFAILYVLHGQFGISVAFICFAAIFDRFDGKVARKLNVTSAFGKQLDSLCDIVSFGVAPALLIYQSTLIKFGMAGSIFAIIFITCGAIRLARFNISEQDGCFVGLPITAAGCILTASHLFSAWITPPAFMFLILALSILMISTFRIKKV